MWNAGNQYKARDLKEVETVARALSITLHPIPIRGPEGLDDAFGAAVKANAQALLTLDDPFTIAQRARITALALKHKLPSVYAVSPFAEAGGLMSYGPNREDQSRRAAAYVDRILKGAKPMDLPVQQPTRFELVVNLKTAKTLGLTLPALIMARADQVIQ
jgi:putative ABC transport system substrate-binding protein